MKRLPLFIVLALLVVPILGASGAAVDADRIRENETKQQQLRGESQRLAEQLETMAGEYERNGLTGEEVKTVRELQAAVQKLSAEEMRAVVELLEKARSARDTAEAKQRVSDAYTSQKVILTEMQKLLAEHLRNQQAQEISAALAKLADRQAANLQSGITLGQWSAGKKPDNFAAAMEANLQGQQSEQKAIAEELRVLGQRMANFAKDPENAEAAARFSKGMESLAQVQPRVDNAAEALKAQQLFKAVEDEKVARDAMRRLAREMAPPQDRAEALRTAQRELEKMVEEQTELVGEVGQRRTDPALTENKQGNLAGRGEELTQNLQKHVPAAAQDVKGSVDKMQEARGAMMDRKTPEAAQNAREALAGLMAAQEKVKKELAKAEALAGKSGDAAKDLQAMQKQAEELARAQAAAAQNPDKAGQPALTEKIAQAARQMGNLANPAAAQAMQQAAMNAQKAAQAAQAMQQAQQAARGVQAPAMQAQQAAQAAQAQQAAGQAQQAAAQNLAQAAQQLAQQAAQAAQAQQQMAAIEQAMQELAQIIVSEQNLKVETAASVAKMAGKTETNSSFPGQAGKQEVISNRTGALLGTLPPEAVAARPPLTEARTQMDEAKQHLDKPAGKLAEMSEQKALDYLLEAQTALQQAAQQALAAAAPGAMPNANALQQAAQQLAQAQQAVAQAQQQLQQAQNAAPGSPTAQKAAAKAAGQLAQAAAQAGQAAAMAQAGPAAQQGAQQAQKAAGQGAAQAAGQNVPGAQAQANAAAQALAQAQMALAQMQSGVMAANGPGMPGQPGQPGQPGSQPGQPGQPGMQPGQTPGMPNGAGSTGAQEVPPEGNEAVQTGVRTVANRKGAFAGLPARERAVIEQAQGEKYPEEYGAQVEQYLLNLARESAGKK